MLTDKEIFDAVNEAPLGRTGQGTVIAVGRAIEAKVLGKLGEPVAWQWRRKGDPWTPDKTFSSEVCATTADSEVRALYAAPSTPKAAA